MTNLWTMTKILTRQRCRWMNRIVLVDIIAIILTLLFEVYKGEIKTIEIAGVPTMYAIPAIVVGFIIISRLMEHVYVSNAYRLTPVTDTSLYSANLLSGLISLVYLGILQAVIVSIGALLSWSDVVKSMRAFYKASPGLHHLTGMTIFGGTIGAIFLSLVLALLGWAIISLIHLVTTALVDFLPDSRQHLYRILLYIVVIGVVLYVVSYVIGITTQSISTAFSGITKTGTIFELYLSASTLLVSALVGSALNVYLLKNWVETAN